MLKKTLITFQLYFYIKERMWALSSRIFLPLAWRLDPVIEGLGGGADNGGSARHHACHSSATESLSKKIEAEYSLPHSLGGGDDGLSGAILGHCSGFSATQGEMTKQGEKQTAGYFPLVFCCKCLRCTLIGDLLWQSWMWCCRVRVSKRIKSCTWFHYFLLLLLADYSDDLLNKLLDKCWKCTFWCRRKSCWEEDCCQ